MSQLPPADVLVVGPEGSTIADLSGELREAGALPTHVTTAASADDRIETAAVDSAVVGHTDDFDGLDCLESLRATAPELPVVFVPSTVTAEIARRAVAADVDALVAATEADLAESVMGELKTAVDLETTQLPISALPAAERRRLKERALDEAPIGITIADATAPDLPTIYINESFEDVTGYAPAEAAGRNLRFLQGPETDPDQIAKLRAGIDADRDTRVVLRNYRQDGTPYWSQVQISPLYDDSGEVTHYVGFQLDVTDRKRAQQQLRAERESLDRLLDRIQGLVDETTEILVGAASRQALEAQLTDRLGEEYGSAWLGRYAAADDRLTITHQTGDHEPPDSPIELTADSTAHDALAVCLETATPQRVDETPLFDLAAEEQCVLVPLSYRSTTYGVVGVIARASTFDDREQVLLGALGRSIGASIHSRLTKRTLTTDTVLTVGVELFDDGLLFPQLAAAVETTFEYEAIVATDRDRGVLVVVSTPCDVDRLTERAMAFDSVRAVDPIVDGDDAVVQFHLADSPLVEVLSTFGSRLTAMDATDRRLAVEFSVPTEATAQSLLDALRERYDRVDLVAHHESAPQQTPRGFREEFRSQLTDRQLTALTKAYVSGYFEWPRQVDGSQLAASMDIVPSTYHQHLQAATRKLVEAVFESS